MRANASHKPKLPGGAAAAPPTRCKAVRGLQATGAGSTKRGSGTGLARNMLTSCSCATERPGCGAVPTRHTQAQQALQRCACASEQQVCVSHSPKAHLLSPRSRAPRLCRRLAAEAAKRYSPPQLDTMIWYRGADAWLLRCERPNCAHGVCSGAASVLRHGTQADCSPAELQQGTERAADLCERRVQQVCAVGHSAAAGCQACRLVQGLRQVQAPACKWLRCLC